MNATRTKWSLAAALALAVLAGPGRAQETEPVTGTLEVEGKSIEITYADGKLSVTVDGDVRPVEPKKPAAAVAARRVIGVRVREPEAPLASQLGVKPEEALVVVHVTEEGPAEKAGVEAFDVITRIQGQSPATLARLRASLDALQVGDPVVLEIIRGGEPRTVRVPCAEEKAVLHLGLETRLATDLLTAQLHLPNVTLERDMILPLVVDRAVRGIVNVPRATLDLEQHLTLPAAFATDLNLLVAPRLVPAARTITPAEGPAPGEKEDRLARIEGRLERIEKLLEKLAK